MVEVLYLETMNLQYISSMAEQSSKRCEIKEVAVEGEMLRSCLLRFEELEERVESAQLVSVHGKYQYFLRKYQKFTEEHQKYKEIYQNISRTVEDSSQIQDENRSIEFINKVMEQTEKKYNKLKQNIDELKAEKQKNQNELIRLRNILIKKKDQYFGLERREEEIAEKRKLDEKGRKNKQHLKTMFKIRQDKKGQAKESGTIQPLALEKWNQLNSSLVERRVMDELQAINRLKQQFLERVGTNINECYREQEREFDQQERANKLISKRKMYLKDRTNVRSMGGYQPQQSAQQVFRIVSNYDRELQQFMSLSSQQVFELILAGSKVKEVLYLIEQEKRELVDSYQKVKYSKVKSS